MSRKTIYNKNISAPAEITNEEYESVGASKFQLGDSRRFFLGANDFEIYTEPSAGTKLAEIDYQLLDLDANLSTLCSKPVFSSLIILNSEYQNCKLYLNYRCVLSQLDAKQMNAMQLQIDANKSLNETQSTILTDHESRITANTAKNTDQDNLIAEIIAENITQDEAHAAHVSNSEIHVTAADKSRWDGKANTYLVDNIAARDALTGLNINDVVYLKDDGDGKRAGYYYNGVEASVLWEKFYDPDWENVSLDWSAIENVPQVLNDLTDDGTGLKYKGADIGTGGGDAIETNIDRDYTLAALTQNTELYFAPSQDRAIDITAGAERQGTVISMYNLGTFNTTIIYYSTDTFVLYPNGFVKFKWIGTRFILIESSKEKKDIITGINTNYTPTIFERNAELRFTPTADRTVSITAGARFVGCEVLLSNDATATYNLTVSFGGIESIIIHHNESVKFIYTTAGWDYEVLTDNAIVGEETLAKGKYKGYQIYRKVIDFGALPNAYGDVVAKAHGIPAPYKTKSVTGIASKGSQELPLPHPNPTDNHGAIYVLIKRTDNTVVVCTGMDLSAYYAYITIEYIKANL